MTAAGSDLAGSPMWLLEENEDRLQQHAAHLRQPTRTALAGYLGNIGAGLLGALPGLRHHNPLRAARTLGAAAVLAAAYGAAASYRSDMTPVAAVAAPFVWALLMPRLHGDANGVPAGPGQADGIGPRAHAEGERMEGRPWQPLQGEGRWIGGPELPDEEPGLPVAERAEGQPVEGLPAFAAEGEPDPAPDDEMRPLLRDG